MLTIIVEGANPNDVFVQVDDKQVPSDLLGIERYADPGQRQIVGKRGNEVVSETATLSEGEKKQITLKFRNAPSEAATMPGVTAGGAQVAAPGPQATQPDVRVPSQPTSGSLSAATNAQPERDQGASSASSQRTAGWIGVGVGTAGLALGATTGLIVAVRHGDLSTECPVNNNCNGQHDSEVSTYNTMRTLSTAGFIVGGVAAVAGVTLLLTAPKTPAQVGLWLSPNAAGIQGKF
jgi:hypothetical protein